MSDTHVYSVLSVSLTILETFPATLQIETQGEARTGGYTNVRLEPRIYIVPPPDGIYEFDFVGTPPSGPATAAISPVSTTYQQRMPVGLKGVRIYTETNELCARLVSAFGTRPYKGTTSTETVARGYSDKYDIREAMHHAISQLATQTSGIDNLSHYVVVRIGAEVGGMADLDRLYVEVRQ